MFSYKIDQDISFALPRPKIDAEPLFNLIDKGRTKLSVWLPWVKSVKSIEDEKNAHFHSRDITEG